MLLVNDKIVRGNKAKNNYYTQLPHLLYKQKHVSTYLNLDSSVKIKLANTSLEIREHNEKLIFLFLNQNIHML